MALQKGGTSMPIISSRLLSDILNVHENLQNKLEYPYFDPACVRYEALRRVTIDRVVVDRTLDKFGLTNYEYRKSLSAFKKYGVAGLIGINAQQLLEPFSLKSERMVFVMKMARPNLPATKMVTILNGFNLFPSLDVIRRLYASYGWAQGTKTYKKVDFMSLNLKVSQLSKLRKQVLVRNSFVDTNDRLQTLLEVFRTIREKGITQRYSGSRVSLSNHKKKFLSIGLLGLVDCDKPQFRNSKVGFAEEGKIIFSKIQNSKKNEVYYQKILEYKKITVDITCLKKIFKRWNVDQFQSKFQGDLGRLLDAEDDYIPVVDDIPKAGPLRLDDGFIEFLNGLDKIPIANPGIFLFLPYLNRLQVFEKISTLKDLDPPKGYSWFSFFLLNLGRIFEGISSVSKACRTHELSLPLIAGLVSMPCNDSLLNGLAGIDESELFQMRQHLTQAAKRLGLIDGKRIAFDFQMQDFTGDDVELKNIGKGPSPKRKICFPGFRPHIAWDVDTGAPISIEFRNGRARGTTTLKRFINELVKQSIGIQEVEHIYLDSEYTAEHIWSYIVDPKEGIGADLTMCIRQNGKVKKHIAVFMETNPTWVYYDENHTYTEQTFEIPIQNTNKILNCVLKRNEKNGKLRCFGSTLKGLASDKILEEYSSRWTIENGIKDLCQNYFLEHIPGIDPHRINIHYYMVTLARTLYEMVCHDYKDSLNPDDTKKTLGTIRPEFMVGTNAVLTRENGTLILQWKDHYPASKHEVLSNFFKKINKEMIEGLPFLGGLNLRFEIAPPRSDKLCNRFRRSFVDF